MSETVENTQEANGQGHAASADARDERLTALEAELAAARKRIDELTRAYLASEQDREAFKGRVAREREQLLDVERGQVAVALIEAIDELELSLAGGGDSPLVHGVRLIRDGLLKRLLGMGVERVPLDGQPFDPSLAEATDMEMTARPEQDGQVLRVVKPAYRLKGRIIRPGRVSVARHVPPV